MTSTLVRCSGPLGRKRCRHRRAPRRCARHHHDGCGLLILLPRYWLLQRRASAHYPALEIGVERRAQRPSSSCPAGTSPASASARASGNGSCLARAHVRVDVPAAPDAVEQSVALLRSRSRFRFMDERRGVRQHGEQGALAHESRAARCGEIVPALSSPTTLPPKGAWAAYNARISSLSQRSSSRSANTISISFSRSVRGFRRD